MTVSIVAMVLGVVLAVAGFVLGIAVALPVGLLLFVGGTIGLIVTGQARSKASLNQAAAPIGHTREGQPIYPVVGYTPDGAPVTADRAVGVRPYNPNTNTFAIVALILAFVFPLLAIPFGHVARGQIRRTGEQGGALALAGLIIAYVSVVAGIIVAIVFAASLNI
ncbi:DUF4190 domain-containing protein [Mycolicibacterium sp. XJ1819]